MLQLPLLTLTAAALLADVIVLKNGNEIQGEIVSEDETRVVVKFPGGTLALEQKKVARIRRQNRLDYLLEESEKHSLRGEHELALERYREALREDPGSVRAQKGVVEAEEQLGFALEDLGRYEDARQHFSRLLEASPSNVRAAEEVAVIDGILAEARREEELGRKDLEAGRRDEGVRRLQRIFDQFPGRRSEVGPWLAAAFVAEGDQHLKKRELERAVALYQKALTTDPDCQARLADQHSAAKIGLIQPAIPGGDFALIERLANEGLDVDPANETLRYYRALALEGTGRVREAADEHAAILDEDRPARPEKVIRDLRLRTEAKLLDEGKAVATGAPGAKEILEGAFRTLRTPHFVLQHRNVGVARDVAFVAERAYSTIFRDLACATHLRQPIRVMIYPTQAEYQQASGMYAWTGGAHRVARRLGDLSEHTIFSFQNQPRLTTGIIPHEIAHALLAHRLNYPDSIPLWANEGVAVSREPEFVHAYQRRILRQELARKSLPPLSSTLLAKDYPEDGRVELFYAQSFSAVEYLLELEGIGAFLAFVRSLCEGRDLEAACHRHYGAQTLLALDNRWRGWLQDQLARKR